MVSGSKEGGGEGGQSTRECRVEEHGGHARPPLNLRDQEKETERGR